jgi:hypothetical protein
MQNRERKYCVEVFGDLIDEEASRFALTWFIYFVCIHNADDYRIRYHLVVDQIFRRLVIIRLLNTRQTHVVTKHFDLSTTVVTLPAKL